MQRQYRLALLAAPASASRVAAPAAARRRPSLARPAPAGVAGPPWRRAAHPAAAFRSSSRRPQGRRRQRARRGKQHVGRPLVAQLQVLLALLALAAVPADEQRGVGAAEEGGSGLGARQGEGGGGRCCQSGWGGGRAPSTAPALRPHPLLPLPLHTCSGWPLGPSSTRVRFSTYLKPLLLISRTASATCAGRGRARERSVSWHAARALHAKHSSPRAAAAPYLRLLSPQEEQPGPHQPPPRRRQSAATSAASAAGPALSSTP